MTICSLILRLWCQPSSLMVRYSCQSEELWIVPEYSYEAKMYLRCTVSFQYCEECDRYPRSMKGNMHEKKGKDVEKWKELEGRPIRGKHKEFVNSMRGMHMHVHGGCQDL